MCVPNIKKLIGNCLILGFVLLPVLATSIYAIETSPKNDLASNPQDTEVLPFLGIGGDFGRWENGFVPIAYNPDGAPSDTSLSEMESLFRSSFTIIEDIADVHFIYQGITTSDFTNDLDGIVVIAWDELEEGVAGRAGPDFGAFNSPDFDRLGYWPYLDGTLRLSTLVATDQINTRVIIHELIHLLGLGHSENPVSIMNTNYSFFSLPQNDDIQALQTLYGPPDQYVRPVAEISLLNPQTGGIEPDLAISGFYSRLEGADVNDINPIEYVDQSLNSGDGVWFRVGFQNANIGEQLITYVTDPHGNTTTPNVDYNPQEVSSVSSSLFFFVGNAEGLFLHPGEWVITIGVNGYLFTTATLLVEGNAPDYNRTPVVTINSEYDGLQRFTLNLDIFDLEGDTSTTNWFVPSTVLLSIQDGNVLTVEMDVSQPAVVQIFGEVIEDNLRPGEEEASGSGPGRGYGALVSRYLVMPAETGVPIYFANEQLLHIPDLEIEGGLFSLNFKLTYLEDISLKFIEFDQLSNISPSGNANLDLTTGELLLSRLIVVENFQVSEINNVRFSLVPNSNPIRIKLEL